MYSLDINFLKDRPELTGSEIAAPAAGGRTGAAGDKRPMYAGIAAGLLFPLLVGAGWLFLFWRIGQLQTESNELEQQLVEVRAKEKQIADLKKEIQDSDAEVKSLASVFNFIKPWSAIFKDISDRAPGGVQVLKVQQTDIEADKAAQAAQAATSQAGQPGAGTADPAANVPKIQLTITGIANSFNEVNDFLLVLQQSNFFDSEETLLQRANLISYPGTVKVDPQARGEQRQQVTIELPEVVSYTIQTQIQNVSSTELLGELQRKGAVGLASRIETLYEQGVIEE